MAIIIKAPNNLEEGFSIFLAGSIEKNAAKSWRQRVEKALLKSDVIIYNPRREEWDSSWEESIENAQFREQVEWELDALDKADIIALYFDPTTKSPISLLELGLHSQSGRMIVCCTDGFWRKGNVDIVCHRYGVEQVSTIEELINRVLLRVPKSKQQ